MSFQVYYRKWRPKNFGELVGQDHVAGTLRQAVQQARIAHSYLFCGPRGTGKTSTARVLAKAANCTETREGDPCNSCQRCEAINDGRYLDLIELDAASNRGIDEIRNIRDRVNLAPAEGGYKVYIIDEAHMLTEHASNAFLKTLEEPPGHAIFVLCTTEAHKILPTIISRCQRFDFRRLSPGSITDRLGSISLAEGVQVDESALKALARGAGGSLRDAENLLEQLVVSHGTSIGVGEVHDLLGLGQGEAALSYTRNMLTGNVGGALQAVNQAAWDGVDLRQLHRQAMELMRGVLLLQCGAIDSLDLPEELLHEAKDLAQKATATRVMKALRLLGQVNTRYDGSTALPLELAAVEACMEESNAGVPSEESTAAAATPRTVPQASSSPPRRTQLQGPPQAAPPPAPTVPAPMVHEDPADGNGHVKEAAALDHTASTAARSDAAPEEQHTSASAPERESEADSSSAQEAVVPAGNFQEQWIALIKVLSRYKGKRFNIGALLRDCKDQSIEGETLVLVFAHRSHLERMQEELDDPQGIRAVKDALEKSLGVSYELKLILGDNGTSGTQSPSQSPLVRTALGMGARIMEERTQ